MALKDEILTRFGPNPSDSNIHQAVLEHIDTLEDRVAGVEKFQQDFESFFGPVEEFWEKWTRVEAEL